MLAYRCFSQPERAIFCFKVFDVYTFASINTHPLANLSVIVVLLCNIPRKNTEHSFIFMSIMFIYRCRE